MEDGRLTIELTVMTAGRSTICEVRCGNSTGTGGAIRHPDDDDDPVTATALALGRALKDLGRDITKTGWHMVRAADRARAAELADARYFVASAGINVTLDPDPEPEPAGSPRRRGLFSRLLGRAR